MQKEVIVTGIKYYQGISAFEVNQNVLVKFDSENPFSNNAFSVFDESKGKLGSIAENQAIYQEKFAQI